MGTGAHSVTRLTRLRAPRVLPLALHFQPASCLPRLVTSAELLSGNARRLAVDVLCSARLSGARPPSAVTQPARSLPTPFRLGVGASGRRLGGPHRL